MKADLGHSIFQKNMYTSRGHELLIIGYKILTSSETLKKIKPRIYKYIKPYQAMVSKIT